MKILIPLVIISLALFAWNQASTSIENSAVSTLKDSVYEVKTGGNNGDGNY